MSAPARKSILLLGSQMETGGAQRLLLNLAHWLHKRGYHVRVVFLYDKEGLWQSWQSTAPFPIDPVRALVPQHGPLRNFFHQLAGLMRLWRILRAERFESILTFTHHSNLFALPLAWLAGVPVRIASHHGRSVATTRWQYLLHRWMVNSAIVQRLVAVSAGVRSDALQEGISPNKIELIVNGVPLPQLNPLPRSQQRARLGLPAEGPFLLSAGRLVPEKAQINLIKAAPQILARYPQATFMIAGEGALRAQLEDEIARRGLSEHFLLPGVRSDLPALMSAADLFVLPSQSEGLPLALLEAMSSACAVVASDLEGITSVLRDGENGLVAPVNDPQRLAERILELLDDPARRDQLGRAAREWASTHASLERAFRAYLCLLDPDTHA